MRNYKLVTFVIAFLFSCAVKLDLANSYKNNLHYMTKMPEHTSDFSDKFLKEIDGKIERVLECDDQGTPLAFNLLYNSHGGTLMILWDEMSWDLKRSLLDLVDQNGDTIVHWLVRTGDYVDFSYLFTDDIDSESVEARSNARSINWYEEFVKGDKYGLNTIGLAFCYARYSILELIHENLGPGKAAELLASMMEKNMLLLILGKWESSEKNYNSVYDACYKTLERVLAIIAKDENSIIARSSIEMFNTFCLESSHIKEADLLELRNKGLLPNHSRIRPVGPTSLPLLTDSGTGSLLKSKEIESKQIPFIGDDSIIISSSNKPTSPLLLDSDSDSDSDNEEDLESALALDLDRYELTKVRNRNEIRRRSLLSHPLNISGEPFIGDDSIIMSSSNKPTSPLLSDSDSDSDSDNEEDLESALALDLDRYELTKVRNRNEIRRRSLLSHPLNISGEPFIGDDSIIMSSSNKPTRSLFLLDSDSDKE